MNTQNFIKINIVFKNTLNSKYLINLFEQKKLYLDQNFSESIEPILIVEKGKCLEIKYKDNINQLNLPSTFLNIFNNIVKILPLVELNFNELKLYPYAKKIEFKKEKVLLNEIHNNILLSLLMNEKRSLNKHDLYEFLWPNDKNIFINKLDTHITNLKNLLHDQINFDLKIISSKGMISLIN